MEHFGHDLTRGRVASKLVRFSIPLLLSNLLQALYNVADMVIVGQYCGDAGISGVAIGGQVTFLVTQIFGGFAVGGTILIAQYIGARRYEDEKQAVGTLFSLFAIAAVVITAVMLPLHAPILRLLDTPEASFADASAYLQVTLGGTIFILGYNSVSAVLRGMGDSRRPLVFVAIAAVLNIILDIIFVGPLGWGAFGAALATVIAQAVSFLFAAITLARSNFIFDFKPRSFSIHRDKAKLIFKLGLPVAIQGGITSLSFLALTGLANRIGGLVASTVIGISGKVNSFAILPNVAFSSAVSAMAGQNIGAGEHDRAKKTMWIGLRLSVALAAVIFALVQLFPGPVLSLFNAGPESMEMGISYLRVISFDYLLTALLFSMNGLITGSGHTEISLINTVLSSIVLRVPLAYLFTLGLSMGMTGLGLSVPLATLGPILITALFIRGGAWKKTKTGIAAAPREV